MPNKIDGSGFDKSPLSNEELAKHREMFHIFAGQQPVIEPLIGVLKSAKTLATVFAICAVIGGGFAWASSMGLF